MKPYLKLQSFWVDTGSTVAWATHDEAEIAALEAKYAVQFPEDFREYLLSCCPRTFCDMDEGLTRWWSLAEIKNIPDEYGHKLKNPAIAEGAGKYLFFADYLIWCWAWAIDCGDDENRGRVAVIGDDDRFVADSFGEFVDMFVLSPDDLF